MKKCSYCGRDNEDSAVQCRECGTSEFKSSPTDIDTPAAPKTATCDRCGAKTDIVEAFFKEKKSSNGATVTYCPDCWQKHTARAHKRLLLYRLAYGLFGVLFVYLNPNDGFGWFLLNLFLFYLALILAILPHEFGHALVAKYVGWCVFRIHIGSGKTIFKARLAGFDTDFHALPLGGLVQAAPRQLGNFRSKLFVFALAGPLANAILAGAAFLSMGGTLAGFGSIPHRLAPLEMILLANLLVAVWNLWPARINTPFGKKSSDGRQLWEAIKSNPERERTSHAAGFFLEGAKCQENKQFGEAQIWLEKGLKLYPDNLPLQIAQGLNWLHLQKFEAARECFLKVLPHAEKNPALRSLNYNNLAYTDAVIGGPELLAEADHYSAEAMNNLSWVPSIKGTRGTVLLELGRIEEAVPLLREAMQKQDVASNKAQNACWLAIAETRLGNVDLGRKYLEQAREFDPTCFLLERAQKILAPA